MIALVRTAHGVHRVDVETGELLGTDAGAGLPPAAEPELSLPLLVAAAASGATVVAVVDRRPPLAVSYDAGTTWSEAGGGLPPGRAVAVGAADPDLVLYAARNRLYVSRDGARFWQALTLELPEIEAVAWSEPNDHLQQSVA